MHRDEIPGLSSAVIHEAAQRALDEDRGSLDITSQSVIPEDLEAKARLFIKEEGVLSGVALAVAVFHLVNAELKVVVKKQDGDLLRSGDTILELEGKARDITTGERVALNFLQHLSGIATETAKYVTAVGAHKARILDTRKTIPGLRVLQKYAVRCGGGMNHRVGLYDEFMIKDNHFAMAALQGLSMADVVREAKNFDSEKKLTVEVDNLDQIHQLMDLDIDQLLLDNMSCQQMEEAVQ
ncbi:MAG: carboxylating nicotinate-nucleotide diphosphorylase, partial [Verrucomicrobiota bacterium]